VEDILDHPVIGVLRKHGITFSVRGDEVVLDGFYKSGEARLVLADGQLVAKTRYDRVTPIEDYRDILELNLYWWEYSQDRLSDWSIPREPWLGELRLAGLYPQPGNY